MVPCTYQAVAYRVLMQTLSEKDYTNFLLSVEAISNMTNAKMVYNGGPENHTGHTFS